MAQFSRRPACPLSPEMLRELLQFTRGQQGSGTDPTPQELRSYLHPLVKRVVQTGAGPRGLTRWVVRQRRQTAQGDPLSEVTELTTRLAEALLPLGDPFTGTVIAR